MTNPNDDGVDERDAGTAADNSWHIGNLRPDQDFDTPRCNRRSHFNADRVESVLCQITAGAGTRFSPFSPEDLRDWLRKERAPDAAQQLAVSDAVMEMSGKALRVLADNCGASIREIAAFVRRTSPRHWTTVWFLNGESRTGSDELPFVIDKKIGAGNIDWMT